MLATQALIYYQVPLQAKQMVGYLKEVVDITCNNKDIQEIYDDSMGQLKGNKTNKSNFFSTYLALSMRVVLFTLRFSATLLTPLMNSSQKYGRYCWLILRMTVLILGF